MSLIFIADEEKELNVGMSPPAPPPPPPEEVPFSVAIVGTTSPVPAGSRITVIFDVTNLGSSKSAYDLMIYANGVPFSSVPFHMDPIPAGETVRNPGPWFKMGLRVSSPTPKIGTYSICVISIPSGIHRDCDDAVLEWT